MKKSTKATTKTATSAKIGKKKKVDVEIIPSETGEDVLDINSTSADFDKKLRPTSTKKSKKSDSADAQALSSKETPARDALTKNVSIDDGLADDVLDDDMDDVIDLHDDLDLMDDLDHEDADVHDDEHGKMVAITTPSLPKVTTSRDNLHLYLKEISRFPMLKPEEEQELAQRVRNLGDTDAAFRLVSSHLRLVVKIAMDFQRRWMQNVLDLIQEGNVGLMRAVNKFDPDKGIKFSYYAAFWIKAYILKFIMNNWRMVKIGTTQVQRKLFFNLNKERQKLISQGFDPDAAMLSEKLGVSIDQIHEMEQRLGASDMSLDMQVSDATGGASRMDFLPALEPSIESSIASTEISKLVQQHLQNIIPKLNEKETYILYNRLLTDEPVTLREIGEKYNVTRERVRQLEARLLEKLRQHLSNDIKDFSEEWINT